MNTHLPTTKIHHGYDHGARSMVTMARAVCGVWRDLRINPGAWAVQPGEVLREPRGSGGHGVLAEVETTPDDARRATCPKCRELAAGRLALAGRWT